MTPQITAGTTLLALTSSGVEQVRPVDPEKMRQLALWLCQDEESACMRFWDSRYSPNDLERRDREYDGQRQENGGFCDHCRDFAAELLVASPLAELVVTP